MAPVSSDLEMAFTGQISMQAGLLHCWHTIGVEKPTFSKQNTEIRDRMGLFS